MSEVTKWFSRNLIRIYAALAFIYLFIPVAYTMAFSFNDAGKRNLIWVGFTLKNWANPCGAPEVCTALGNSLKIGAISTFVATVLGTMIAFALGRYKFAGRSGTNLLIFLPMATPEIVLGASLLAMFLNLGINPGFWPTVIAHIMFCISFVVVTVKARVASLDPKLEEAARDLYANEFETFRRVTFPWCYRALPQRRSLLSHYPSMISSSLTSTLEPSRLSLNLSGFRQRAVFQRKQMS